MIKKFIEYVSFKFISPFNWTRIKFLFTGREYDISPSQRDSIRETCSLGTYLWATRRETHLTTYLINISDYLLSLLAYVRGGFKGPLPKFGFYSHAFLNSDQDSFIEAISKGVIESKFDEVFNVDAVACFVPSNLSPEEWSKFSKKFSEVATSKKGSKYDAVFNIKDEKEVSCIELLRVSLTHALGEEEYPLRFANFEKMISDRKNLTPDMLKECGDFYTLFEYRE